MLKKIALAYLKFRTCKLDLLDNLYAQIAQLPESLVKTALCMWGNVDYLNFGDAQISHVLADDTRATWILSRFGFEFDRIQDVCTQRNLTICGNFRDKNVIICVNCRTGAYTARYDNQIFAGEIQFNTIEFPF